MKFLKDPSKAVREAIKKNPKITNDDLGDESNQQTLIKKFKQGEAITEQDLADMFKLLRDDPAIANHIAPVAKNCVPLQLYMLTCTELTKANANKLLSFLKSSIHQNPDILKKLL